MRADGNNLGVALTKCFFCQGDADILLNTRLTPGHAKAVDAMHGKIVSMEPCQKCTEYMKMGIIVITIDVAKSDPNWDKPSPIMSKDRYGRMVEHRGIPNPYRSGGWWVIKDEAVQRMTPEHVYEWAKAHRFMFIEHEAAEKLGLFEAGKTAPTENEKKTDDQDQKPGDAP